MITPADWRSALKLIPLNVKRKNHGRTLEDGIDCVGLVFVMYKLVGIDLSDLDVPYGERDYREIKPGDKAAQGRRRRLSQLIQLRLAKRFRQIMARDTIELRSGDVILLGTRGTEGHVGMYVDGLIVQMGDRLKMKKIQEAWERGFVSRVYRFTK